MVHLTRIYTRTGDGGQTRLVDMSLTDKTDHRVAAYGDVDEANSQLGVLLATTELPEPMVTLLGRVQNELFDLGADLGNPLQASYAHEPLRITAEYVDRLEADCDAFGDPLPPLRSFVLPGGTPASAHLHVARTIVRRAERTAWSAVEQYGTDAPGGLNPLAITYLNRLSDLLFILSRAANATDPSVDSDVLWVPGGSRHSPDSPPIRRGMTDAVQPTTTLREATGSAQPKQTRPVTLFSGQWADLPFEEVCRLASEWGYDGLEIACWGDHLDVARAAEDDAYVRAKKDVLESYGLGCWAISTHLDSQAVCDAIIDDRHRNMVKPRVWGDGDPDGVRRRAAEEMKTTARAAAALGIDTVIGFTGSSIWHYLAMFPPVGDDVIRAGYADFADRWNPIIDVFDSVGVRYAHEVHPSEIAYDYWSTRTALEAIGHRAGFGLNYDPSHMVWQGLDYVGFLHEFADRIYHVDCKDTKLRMGNGRNGILSSHLPWADPRRGWDFISTGHGDTKWEDIFRMLNFIGYAGPISIEWEDAGMDRLDGAPEALGFIRKLNAITVAESGFDAAFASQE